MLVNGVLFEYIYIYKMMILYVNIYTRIIWSYKNFEIELFEFINKFLKYQIIIFNLFKNTTS